VRSDGTEVPQAHSTGLASPTPLVWVGCDREGHHAMRSCFPACSSHHVVSEDCTAACGMPVHTSAASHAEAEELILELEKRNLQLNRG
jgi:hypothetical protein